MTRMTQIGKSVETSTSLVSNDTSIGTTAYINQAKNNPQPTIIAANTLVYGGVINGDFENGGNTAITAVGWIGGSRAYGWYLYSDAASFAGEFSNAVCHTGKQSLKLTSTTCANTKIVMAQQAQGVGTGVSVKPSTKYRISGWMKTVGIANANGGGAYFDQVQYTDQTFATYVTSATICAATRGDTDWTYYSAVVTTAATTNIIFLRAVINSETGVAYYDDFKIEQVIEDTGYTGTIPTPLLSTIVGVTSVDNIDIDKLSIADGGANFDSNYWLGQQFVPTRNKFVGFVCKLYKGGSPTGNLTISIEGDDGSNKPNGTVVAGTTVDVATLTTTPTNYTITLPCLLTVNAKYWVCFKGLTAWDVNNTPYVYYKVAATTDYVAYGGGAWTTNAQTFTIGVRTLFAKPTCHPVISCNNEQLNLDTGNEDGLLHGAVINLDEGTYNWSFTELAYDAPNICGIFSASNGGYVASTSPQALNAWYNHAGYFQAATTTSEMTIVYRINTIVPVKDSFYVEAVVYGGSSGSAVIQGSTDNISWTTIAPGSANGTYYFPTGNTQMFKGLSTFYIRYYKPSPTNEVPLFGLKHIRCELDTSSIVQPIIYPLATNQFSEKIDTVYNTARIYFRLNKFYNKNGVAVPHLEFTDATAGHIYKIPLPIDNSYETNPSVSIIIASTTNGQQVGTGSDESTTGYILNDGEYMTLSTAVKTFTVTYKIGAGTTSFSNITKNVIFTACNSNGLSAYKESSCQMTVALWYRLQSIARTITDLTQKVNDIINEPPDGYWQDWIPTLAFGTGTPASITISKARWMKIGKTVFIDVTFYSADSNGCTSCTITLPFSARYLPGSNTSLSSYQRYGASGTTYGNPLAYIRTDTSMDKIQFAAFNTCTDGQYIVMQVAGCYEIQ